MNVILPFGILCPSLEGGHRIQRPIAQFPELRVERYLPEPRCQLLWPLPVQEKEMSMELDGQDFVTGSIEAWGDSPWPWDNSTGRRGHIA